MIATLAQCDWINNHQSIILIGDSGTGKTHLATALGICGCQQGRRVRFTTLAQLANELQEAQTTQQLTRIVTRYTKIELLIIDELGYLALPDGAAELVFQVLSQRHEKSSLIVTTNFHSANGQKYSETRHPDNHPQNPTTTPQNAAHSAEETRKPPKTRQAHPRNNKHTQ